VAYLTSNEHFELINSSVIFNAGSLTLKHLYNNVVLTLTLAPPWFRD